MIHLDEGTIVATRDDELVDVDSGRHLAGCLTCRVALDDAGSREERIRSELGFLDAEVDVDAAKAAVRARLDARRDADVAPRRPWGRHLGRAAGVLLVAAGAAYALPGSPLRSWPFGGHEAPTGAQPAPPGTQDASVRGGIEVNVPDGRIRVVLSEVAPGSSIEVLWTETATARISAPAGSSFSFGDGRAEASVAPGPVQVSLPRFAPVVSLEVDGRTFLRRASGGLEVLEPTLARSDDRLIFVVSAR